MMSGSARIPNILRVVHHQKPIGMTKAKSASPACQEVLVLKIPCSQSLRDGLQTKLCLRPIQSPITLRWQWVRAEALVGDGHLDLLKLLLLLPLLLKANQAWSMVTCREEMYVDPNLKAKQCS